MSKRRRELVLEENSETSTDEAQEPSTSIATQKKIVRQFKNTKIRFELRMISSLTLPLQSN